ncbi:glutamine-hydrolyzing GMP synthase, partial [Porphyromonas sp.]
MQEKILILDFGSQTTQLIGRRLRELNTYCEIVPYNKVPEDLTGIAGIILSGSPYSVYDEAAFRTDLSALRGRLPILGICYGAQSLVHQAGGKVEPCDSREYGRAHLTLRHENDKLLEGITPGGIVWMSHGDTITTLPKGFRIIASTEDVEAAAFRIDGERTWGVQFHPEAFHSEEGLKILDNFLKVTGIRGNWSPASFVESTVAELRAQLGDDKVILALSGGVDSSVTAVLLHKAIGKNLTCIFVDHGLLRKNEYENVLRDYEHLGLNVIGVNARDKFLSALKGVTDPEEKRKIIGRG